jgi:hypothetical protein
VGSLVDFDCNLEFEVELDSGLNIGCTCRVLLLDYSDRRCLCSQAGNLNVNRVDYRQGKELDHLAFLDW